jgi:hypothetical protein
MLMHLLAGSMLQFEIHAEDVAGAMSATREMDPHQSSSPSRPTRLGLTRPQISKRAQTVGQVAERGLDVLDRGISR